VEAAPISAAGLVLDVGGAVALASAFAFKRPRQIREEAGSYFGFNGFLLLSLAKQTADAWIGGSLLVLGFAGQFLGTIDWSPAWASYWVTLTVAINVLACSLVLLAVARAWNVRRSIDDYLRSVAEQEESLTSSVVWFSRAAGLDPTGSETYAELAAALLGRRRWERLRADVPLPERMFVAWGTPR
jgi:hypothetical protein